METSVLNSHNNHRDESIIGDGDHLSTIQDDTTTTLADVRIPIVGYEVMDERARFTVFKLKIENEKLGDSWLVFRRYTDFVRLHNKLKEEFPSLHIPLPPKRWLRDNFEQAFLEDRMKGLQAFVDSILLLQPNLTHSPTVREFFCLDEPPVYPENAEESRAMFGTVEENIMHLKQQLSNKDLEIEILKAELALVTSQRDSMIKSIKSCKNCSQRLSFITSPMTSFETSNLDSSEISEKTRIQPVPARQRNTSTSDLSTSSSVVTDKSLQNSPKTSPAKDSTSSSSEPKLNGKHNFVIGNGGTEDSPNTPRDANPE